MGTYCGINSQLSKDRSSGKLVDFLKPGLKNASLKCTTEVFTAKEVVPAGSTIMIASVTAGVVPAFVVIEATRELAGQIGTVGCPNLFGCFDIRAGKAAMVMPALPNEPATAGDIFIKTICDFPAGSKISIKIVYTQ